MSDTQVVYALAADAILILHTLFVAFVVLGLILIFAGYIRAWQWVRNRWFRIAHLAAIAVVVAQSWLGMICPLTSLEMELRTRAGLTAYQGSFITHWLSELIYYRAPDWVFVVLYSLFGALVLFSWYLVPPRSNV